jgi:hypothetical protein
MVPILSVHLTSMEQLRKYSQKFELLGQGDECPSDFFRKKLSSFLRDRV